MARLDVHNPAPDGSLVPKLCTSCVARHQGVCGALRETELATLAKSSGKRHIKAGGLMIAEADPVLTYSNIMSGVAKLSKTLPDGRQQIVELQFAPDFVGRPFDEESHLNIEAATDVHVCTFPKGVFERMLNENPEMKNRIFQQTLRQLDETREWLVTLGRKTAREKIASFLVFIARHARPATYDEHGIEVKAAPTPQNSIVIELPLSRADMADFLGLTIETVSRQLTSLRKTGHISMIDARHIEIPSMRALINEAGD